MWLPNPRWYCSGSLSSAVMVCIHERFVSSIFGASSFAVSWCNGYKLVLCSPELRSDDL
jgi:hypothetical protein